MPMGVVSGLGWDALATLGGLQGTRAAPCCSKSNGMVLFAPICRAFDRRSLRPSARLSRMVTREMTAVRFAASPLAIGISA